MGRSIFLKRVRSPLQKTTEFGSDISANADVYDADEYRHWFLEVCICIHETYEWSNDVWRETICKTIQQEVQQTTRQLWSDDDVSDDDIQDGERTSKIKKMKSKWYDSIFEIP